MENKDKNYKYYINGLKGTACLFIMIGHYLGLYKHAQQFSPTISLLDIVLGSPVSFLIDEGYWLYLFFVVSGYLVAKSNVKTVRDIIQKIINRFLRFAFPILFVYIIIYMLYIICGFHAAETANIFQCDWYQHFYLGNYSVKDVLLSPFDVLFRGNTALNRPYWVLKDMFISSIIIYILKYCYLKLIKKKHEAFCFSALVIVTFASFFISSVIFSCLLGMLISFYEGTGVEKKSYFAFWIIAVLMVLYILPKYFVSTFFFATLIIYIPNVKWIDRLLSSKVFQFFGKISWGVYSFHWPLICSIGALSIINLYSIVGLKLSYAISFLIVLIVTLVLAIAFHFSFEKLASFLQRKMI